MTTTPPEKPSRKARILAMAIEDRLRVAGLSDDKIQRLEALLQEAWDIVHDSLTPNQRAGLKIGLRVGMDMKGGHRETE